MHNLYHDKLEFPLFLLTHFILRDELYNKAHVIERSFVRIVGDDSRRFRRKFRGYRRRKSIALPKVRYTSIIDNRHLQIHLSFQTLVLVHRLKRTSQTA